MKHKTIRIGNRIVGMGMPTYIIFRLQVRMRMIGILPENI